MRALRLHCGFKTASSFSNMAARDGMVGIKISSFMA
jgi:hypothetical protein